MKQAEKFFKEEWGDDVADDVTVKLKHGLMEMTMQEIYETMEKYKSQESDSLPCVSECHEAKVAEYWHQRSKKAEAYINESPCVPDITDSQLKAWREYQDFISE